MAEGDDAEETVAVNFYNAIIHNDLELVCMNVAKLYCVEVDLSSRTICMKHGTYSTNTPLHVAVFTVWLRNLRQPPHHTSIHILRSLINSGANAAEKMIVVCILRTVPVWNR